MKEYISELKTYDFYSEFKPGYYLDAYDEHRWKVGQIKQITKYGLRTTIEVHFDGYNSRFDQRYDLPSSHKLAPFRTHTLPYTGPFDSKRDDPVQKYSTYLKDFSKIVNNTKDQTKPTVVNQFIRGELFIAADYIITKRYFETNFTEASNFLIGYIKEGAKFMNICSQYLKELEKQNFDASLFNVHPKIAIVLSLTEYLFILNSIVGNKDSRCEIEKNYEKWISPQVSFAKKIKQLINDSNLLNICDKIMDFKSINGKSLPWSLKKQACLLLSYLREGYIFPTPTDHKQIIQILDYMSYFSNKGLLPKEQEQKKSLSLIISLIISGNFEGRLRGLNELKKILQHFLRKKDNILGKIQQTDLLNFLIDNKNFNPEIFKRSLPLFAFCYSNKYLTKKDLSQILTLYKDKHELQLKGFYSSLAEFPSFLDAETIIWLFKQITTLPLNEMLVTLIKEYTAIAITKNSTFRTTYCKQGNQLGLTYYWALITSEKNDISSELKYKMIQAFASLLGDLYYSKQAEKFISLALKGIANRKNLEFYFKIIHQTLKLSKSSRMGKYVETLQKEVNIVDCVIEGLRNTQTLSDKIWQCMFQFLQEVTFVSRKKLNFSQIKEFWNIRQCRPFLYKLLRKFRLKGEEDKSQQKIVNKQLSLDVMKQVITKIFLDAKQMDNYETIPPQLYQTADQLIVAFNHNIKSIDYNYKHTIRVRAIQNIFGTQFYLNIINNCKQKDIIDKSIHRFVEFFMRVKDIFKNNESIKLSNWNYILQKLCKLKRNTLLSYKIFLEDLNGRMKSLNILEPDLVQLVVLNKTTGAKRLMSVPRFTSLWKFRALIGEEFNLPNLNFDLQLIGCQTPQTNFQKQQDFSMALISIIKDNYSVSIIQTKNKHPHLQTLDAFYKIFSQLRGQQLYQWLNKQEGKQALQILNKLPSIKRIQQKIVKLSFKDINEIFDSSSMYKLYYQLKILSNQKNPKMLTGMIQKGFIPYISKIFTNKESYKQPEYYPILSTLMGFFNDMIKFAKLVKNAQLFYEGFLLELLHTNKLQCSEYYDYIAKCFTFLKDLSSNRELISSYSIKPGQVVESKQFQNVFQSIVLNKSKEKISENIVDFARQTNNESNLLQLASRLMKSQILIQKQASCGVLFDIISLLIEKKMPSIILENLKSLTRAIKSKAIMQQNEEIQNELLIGYFGLVLKLIKNKISGEQLQEILGEKLDKYFNFIINQCLFSLQDPSKIRFKSATLRYLGYQIISQFQYTQIGSRLSEAIHKALRLGGTWRKQDEWSITPTKQVTHKYTGLKNLAATCYINSLLQQLFFLQNFRDEIISIDAQTIDDKQNIVLELQNIFAHLKYSQSPVYTTLSLCRKFILDGQPIDPRVQTDVDQFFHSLMDKLQRNLSKIDRKQIIKNLFGGQLSNLIVGSTCEHASQRIEPFLSIRLEIKQKKSLEEALKEFIKGEVLEGDNAYFCEKCDAKVKAVKRVCLKTLPQILIVTLKRFQFDYETMEKFKLNSYCSFPNIVNVLPFTREGIDNEYQTDKSLYQYRLKGVVIHYGISQAGHYTSYIQTEPQKWQYFDDEKISQFNSLELGAEAFGGIEENPFGDDQQKKKNAYLLFYEKIKKSSPKKVVDLTEAPIMRQIKEQNTRIKLLNLLFQPNTQNYMIKLGQKKLDPKIFMAYFHLVFLRSAKKRQKLESVYSCAEMLLKNSKQVCTWYLNQINQSFIYQFLLYSQYDIKLIVTSLIIEAFKQNDAFDVGINLLQQLCAFIGKRNLLPAYKIIATAVKMKKKQYEKYLKDICLPQMILLTTKNYPTKQPKVFPKQSQLKLKKTDNYFGYNPMCVYTDRIFPDQIDLIQCIDIFRVNLNIEDIQPLIKRAKKVKTQESIAAIIAKRYIELEHFPRIQGIISEALSSMDFSAQQQHVYTFYMILAEHFALIKDQNTPKRIERIAMIFIKAIGNGLYGYKANLLLIQGLVKICSGNSQFRDRISDQFQEKQGKSLLKSIKVWLKDVSTNLNNLVRSGKMGYWRKPQQKSVPYRLLSSYLESDQKINYEKILAALNAIVEKHNSFFNGIPNQISKDDIVKYQGQKHRFLRQYGLLSEIVSNDRIKIVTYEDLTRMEYLI